MKDYYNEYWGWSHPPPTQDPLASARAGILWRLIDQDQDQGKRFLEIGSGSGNLVAAAASRGLEATGFDISELAVNTARSNFPAAQFQAHAVEERPWPTASASVEVVVAFEVIVHLLRLAELIRGASEAFRPGGHPAITTPYHGLVKNMALAARGFDRHFEVEGDHIRFFTDRALCGLLEREGLKVERIVHFGRVWGLWAGTFVWATKRRAN